MSYWYMGSPYSKYAAGLGQAHIDVCKEVARYIQAGVPVYSPIAHTHPVAIYGGVDPLDHSIWLPADRPMMDAAHGLIVLKMEGWGESFGLKYEVRVFTDAKKPIIYAEVGQDVDEVLSGRKAA
jgi:hypothetical protein